MFRGSISLQLDRPVRLVEELLPRRIPLVGQPNIDHRAALRLHRLAEQLHVRLFGRAAALLYVALDAAADDVVPARLAVLGARDDVVERQFARVELLPAILTAVAVPREDVSP